MGAVIGGVLPLAVGVAISPIPIVAAILMLLSPRARSTSVGFLLGWVLGIVVVATAFTALAGAITGGDGGPQPVVGVLQLVLGAALLVLAMRSWRGRPRPGEDAALPAWMGAIDEASFPTALGFGFLLSAVNPKNLLLCASAGLTIGAGTADAGAAAVAIAVFAVLAAATVAVPVIGYLIAEDRLRGPLDSLRGWLVDNNALIMAVLLLVIGTSLLGKGIGQF